MTHDVLRTCVLGTVQGTEHTTNGENHRKQDTGQRVLVGVPQKSRLRILAVAKLASTADFHNGLLQCHSQWTELCNFLTKSVPRLSGTTAVTGLLITSSFPFQAALLQGQLLSHRLQKLISLCHNQF